jgi:hypothetical protein
MIQWPTTKAGILQGVREEHRKLGALFAGLTEGEMVARETPEAWSAKDIMAHITAWEQMLVGWYQTGLKGIKQEMPDWSKTDAVDTINKEIYERNLKRSLDDIKKDFHASYKTFLKTVEKIPEEDMFVPGRYEWLGKATLALGIIGNGSHHYTEHFTALEAIRKRYGK